MFIVDCNKFKRLKANRDKVKEKQKQNNIILKHNDMRIERLMK